MDAQVIDGDLVITIDEYDRSEQGDFAGAVAKGWNAAEDYVTEALHERFEFIGPEKVAALTAAPILARSDDVDMSDEADAAGALGRLLPTAEAVWWYPDYAVLSPWEELLRDGKVIFTRGEVEHEG